MQDSLYSTPSQTASYSAGSATVLIVIAAVVLVFALATLMGAWKMYTKAGKPGWAVLVPIYNILVLCEIIGRPWWWLLLLFVPFVSWIASAIMAVDQAKAFGKSTAFGLWLLWVFPVIGTLILGFGSAQYGGPAAAGVAPAGPATPPANPTPPPAATPPASTPPASSV